MREFGDGSGAGDDDTAPITIYDIQAAEESKVRVRALPRLTRQALRLAWAAGRVDFTISTLLQIIGGGGIVVLLLLGQQALQANSGSGDISVSATSGPVDLRSASGSLTIGIADNLPAWLDLNSVSGDIRIGLESTVQPEPGEPYITVRARTASGDIAIYRA